MFPCNPISFISRCPWRRSVLVPGLVLLALVLGAAAPCPAQSMMRNGSGNHAAPAESVPAASAAAVPANYMLSPNDLVEVKVFQEDDMDWTVRVTKDGTVNIPLVGPISVVHKTPDELGSIVAARLHDGYLVHPQVSVAVMEFSKRRFTILGEVNRAGQIDFPDNADVDVLQAIGMAGGYTKGADPHRVYVKRQVGGRQVVLTMDAGRMARREAAPFRILPGDTITVSETPF